MSQSDSTLPSWVSTRTIAILVLLGVMIFTGYFGLSAYLDYNSNKERVSGTVTSAEVDQSSGGRRGGTSYYPEITYKYEYNGQTYTNDNLKPGIGSSSVSQSEAESIVADYPENQTVTVYVDSSDLSTSWLQDQLPIRTVALSALFSAVSGVILYTKFIRTSSDAG